MDLEPRLTGLELTLGGVMGDETSEGPRRSVLTPFRDQLDEASSARLDCDPVRRMCVDGVGESFLLESEQRREMEGGSFCNLEQCPVLSAWWTFSPGRPAS